MNGNADSYLNLILFIAIIGGVAYFAIRLLWPKSSEVPPFPKATAKRPPIKWENIEDDAKSDDSEPLGSHDEALKAFEEKPFRQARPRFRSDSSE